MTVAHSPWVEELDPNRPTKQVSGTHTADVLIIGGGISGITTAAFILTHTQKTVALIEAGKIASGATSRNAGQLVACFEFSFAELVRKYGLELAGDAEREYIGSWDLLDSLMNRFALRTKPKPFVGHEGFNSLEECIEHLRSMALRKKANLELEPLRVARESGIAGQIASEYKDFFTVVPHVEIRAALESENKSIIACSDDRRAMMNTARFSEELAVQLQTVFPERFSLFEKSPVLHLTLSSHQVEATCHGGKVHAQEVILCTNGFDRLDIRDEHGTSLSERLRTTVHGFVGYMSGYKEKRTDSFGVNYLPQDKAMRDVYYYMGRYTKGADGKGAKNKISGSTLIVGGPERHLADTAYSSKEERYLENAGQMNDAFLRDFYRGEARGKSADYHWQGLMGYTSTGIRIVGRESRSPRLLYNLGCNGIGAMPAISSGMRMARIIGGEKMPASIFDPR